MAVFLDTDDDFFAQTLKKAFIQWGWGVFHRSAEDDSVLLMEQAQIDVALLDIRHSSDSSLGLLKRIRESLPAVEIILINSHDNIRASMVAMQAGANDEIIVPCDTVILRKKITDAFKRRKKALRKKRGMSFFEMLSESMSAATFAQAGEFEAAIEYMNESRRDSEEKDKDKQKKR